MAKGTLLGNGLYPVIIKGMIWVFIGYIRYIHNGWWNSEGDDSWSMKFGWWLSSWVTKTVASHEIWPQILDPQFFTYHKKHQLLIGLMDGYGENSNYFPILFFCTDEPTHCGNSHPQKRWSDRMGPGPGETDMDGLVRGSAVTIEVSGEVATCCPSMASLSATGTWAVEIFHAMGAGSMAGGQVGLGKNSNGRGFGDSNVLQPNECQTMPFFSTFPVN